MPKTLLQTSPTDVLALAADLRYALDITARLPDANGKVELDDRAVNIVSIATSIQTLVLKLPSFVSGRARDLIVRLELAANVTAPGIETDGGDPLETEDGSMPTIATTTEAGATAVTMLYFSEVKTGTFMVKGVSLTGVA